MAEEVAGLMDGLISELERRQPSSAAVECVCGCVGVIASACLWLINWLVCLIHLFLLVALEVFLFVGWV